MAKKDLELLVDRFEFKATLLEDKRSTGGKIIARGEFARANLATENKRMYPRTLWEREIKRLDKQIQERKTYGELDHPMDGRTQLKRVSHLITNLHMEGDVMMGEAEILDTAEGRNLKAILDAGGQVGVSSRGFGTTRPNTEGVDVVQDDYRLMTFDFVAEPANVTSYPSIHVEAKKPAAVEASMSEDIKSLEKLKASNPALYENLMKDAEREWDKKGAEIWAKKIMAAKESTATDLRASFAEQLQQALADAKQIWTDEVRSELLKDPTVAGAKTALESLKQTLTPFVTPGDVEAVSKEHAKVVESLQKEISDLKEENAKMAESVDKLSGIAKEAGYRYALEKLLSGQEQAELIRKIVGDVKQYESVESMNAKVIEAVEEIKKAAVKHEERDREMERLKHENAILKTAAEKALEATKQMGLQAYVESRLLNHPRRDEIRGLFEHVQPGTKEDVDQLLSKFREKRQDPGALEEARARVRSIVGSGAREALIENEERPVAKGNRGGGNYNELGQDLESLRALSGIGTPENN